MTRTVGSRNRSEFVLDPAEAFRRGCRLDAMLSAAAIPRPRGVLRARHRDLNAIDDRRGAEAARRVNARS